MTAIRTRASVRFLIDGAPVPADCRSLSAHRAAVRRRGRGGGRRRARALERGQGEGLRGDLLAAGRAGPLGQERLSCGQWPIGRAAWLNPIGQPRLVAAIVMTQNTCLRDKRIDRPGESFCAVAPFPGLRSFVCRRAGCGSRRLQELEVAVPGQRRGRLVRQAARCFAKPDLGESPPAATEPRLGPSRPVAPGDLVERRRPLRRPVAAPRARRRRLRRAAAGRPAGRLHGRRSRPRADARGHPGFSQSARTGRSRSGRRRARHDRMRRGAARRAGRATSTSAPATKATARSC